MKERIQVSLNPKLVEKASKLMADRDFDSLSELIEALIREEWESRNPGGTDYLNDATSSAWSDRRNAVKALRKLRKKALGPDESKP